MSGNIGFRPAVIAFIILGIFITAFIATQPGKVSARANLTAYMNVPPNGWEPMGYNDTGTAPWMVVNTVGWNKVKIMGNVGVGNGSANYLNSTSVQDHHYTDPYFMAADVTQEPYSIGATAGTMNDPYHSILIGKPVDDLMYEYPLSPAISCYGRLVGLPMPGGAPANVGIRSLGYGY